MKEPKKSKTRLQENIATNVKHYRLRMGLSQEEFADVCGYHRTYIGSIERSERNITVATLETLAIALKVLPADLLNNHG